MRLNRIEIVFKLPIACADCGVVCETEAQKLELQDVDAQDIDGIVKRQKIGTSFPVGWASYHGIPHNIYRCPKCVVSSISWEFS